MPGEIGTVVFIVFAIVSGRCLLFVRPRCGSTSDQIARHKGHKFDRTDFSAVHFLGVLVLQHPLDDVQPQCPWRWDAQIVIQGKVLIFAGSKCNQQLNGRLRYVSGFSVEDVWRTAGLGQIFA